MNTPSDFLAKIATALNLSDHSENEILRYIEDLQDKASQAEGLKTKLSEVQEKLESLNEKVLSETVENLVAKGLKEKKLTVALAESLKKDYKTNPEGLEALIENMPVQYSAVGQLRRDIPEKYRGKTYRDLYVSGELEEVKEHFPALFESLKKQDHKNN
ncbi:MAG: hypothetical protein FDW93_00735 [Bergeyella sp.]|nr:hypothetical protein [Bergeyella sp.]